MKSEKQSDRMAMAAFCAMGILSDPSDLPKVVRKGRKLTCSKSVAVLVVRQADDILKELDATQK